MTIGFDSLPCCVRLECFGYLTIQDLGTVAQLNYELSRSVATDHVWKSLYPTTFTRAKDSIPHDIQQLVNRPYRRSCIGWSVSVLQDGSDTWLTGIVLEYRNDRFLVRYDLDDSLVWERETLSSGAWFLAGKLRMRFLSAPSLESPMAKPVDPPACPMEDEIASSTVSTKQRKRRRIDTTCSESSMYSSSSTASSSCESPSPLSSPSSACIDEEACASQSANCHSWRCELFRDRFQAPTGLVQELKLHSDEVLCVAFSHASNRLASCSRDGTTRIFDVADNITSVLIQHNESDVPCRVSWSSDDSLILVCTEAKNGNIFDYDAHVACYCSFTGRQLLSKPNIPFDVCAAWIPGTHAFIHGDSLTVSPRGTYNQTLTLWDMDSQRVVGRFLFKFISEAFIHLIQVSPDGNFLAVTCGIGDALSDTVRVVRIPPFTTGPSTTTSFSIKVPRSKFDSERLLANSFFENRKISNIASINPARLVALASPCCDGDPVVPSYYCGGAVLGLVWSKDSRTFYTNTRVYVSPAQVQLDQVKDVLPPAILTDRPDLDNTLEIQAWSVEQQTPVARMKGAHGFTTKECPFYLFLAESPCGEYVASGSEDCGVYLYHVRHKRLMRVLWAGHDDVVSMVSWNPAVQSGCLLASASDDHKICLWGPKKCEMSNQHVFADRA